ncbi:translation elongation factor Ts [Sulfuriroseicoccus oceanibius]|uniref:Elongation factor Ts n=1 Tax=Sulfuriroseicoccus oceanibius TaxID=2707525 RepID=A0A6B3L5R4_9BACT|nr:translation elongation factor Ts [Sulfuriroseicoccus oceanibius]QQL45117.1 elongation factor Ts [Sulfuriroseicoccus oceanibius]
MAISASQVMELRRKTNAGMMDCKKALTEAEGDLDLAEEILRKKGIAKAGKKADRVAAEGTINAAVSADGKTAVLVEVSCETDFVAKNDNFQNFASEITQLALDCDGADNNVEAFLASQHPSGDSIEEVVKAKIAEVGENIVIRNVARFQTSEAGSLTSYLHMGGKVGVLVELVGDSVAVIDNDAVRTLAKDITLHIAAINPQGIAREDIPAEEVEKERAILADSDEVKSKPEQIRDKIVDGKINKFFAQICLLEQGFVKDPDTTVGKLVETTGKAAGGSLTVKRFVRFAVGG